MKALCVLPDRCFCCLTFPLYSLCYFAKPEIALSLSHPRYQSSLNSLCKTEPTICLAADLQKLAQNANKAADLNVCDINL